MAQAWLPSTAEVAAVIPERTQSPSGDFTSATNPTQTQVTTIIGGIVAEVQTVTGVADAPTSADQTALAKLTAEVGSAAMVELAFTTDTSNDVQSKYEQLYQRYKDLLDRLRGVVAGGTDGESMVDAQWGFPDPVTDPLVPATAWKTRW